MRRCLLFCLLPLLSVATAHAADGARARLDAFAARLTGLEARFEQTVTDADGRVREQSEGRVALRAPQQFRWDTERPFQQLVVADGDHVWIFDPDLEQVTVRQQGIEEQSSPLVAIADPAELDRLFSVSEGGAREGLQWLRLLPREEDAPFREAQLGFADDGLQRMTLDDQLGQRTEIRFSGWRTGDAADAALYRFTPPPGVDVIGEIAPSAEVTPLGD